MAGQFGNFVAGRSQHGRIQVWDTEWTLLSANGSTNLAQRAFVFIQNKSKSALALRFVERGNNNAATFTTPTANTATVQSAIEIAGGDIASFPVGDGVALFGRIHPKAGSPDTGGNVVVVEFS